MRKRKEPIKLNLGCGTEKLPGYINIDTEKSCKPDLIWNILEKPLPYQIGSVEEVVLFHTIEHIQKRHHHIILKQIHKVLKPKGRLLISYPEWLECAKRWVANHKGHRDFWEKTMYGRQLYPSDHHVCIMDSDEFKNLLEENGFIRVKRYQEPEPNEFNTIIECKRSVQYANYEDLMLNDMKQMKIVQMHDPCLVRKQVRR